FTCSTGVVSSPDPGRSGATASWPAARSLSTMGSQHQPPSKAPCTITNLATEHSLPQGVFDGSLFHFYEVLLKPFAKTGVFIPSLREGLLGPAPLRPPRPFRQGRPPDKGEGNGIKGV